MPHMLRPLLLLALPSTLSAQAGNEVLFVGTSTSGNADAHYFVESGTGTIPSFGGNIHTDNVTGAVWTDTGRTLYVTQSIQPQVSRAVWDGANATWSTFYSAPGACYGLGLDRQRQRLWVLTGSSGSTRELHCLDVNPSSLTYGSLLGTSSGLGGVSRERWGLSPSGDLAGVPYVFSNFLDIVDTDPQSPTFQQVIVSGVAPSAAGGWVLTSDCEISADDQYAYMLYTGFGSGGIAVLHIPTQTWLDFDPVASGTQNFVISASTPNKMALSLDRSFAVVSGQGGGGWAMRVDFDYNNPGLSTSTQYLAGLGQLPNCDAVSLSMDGTRLAVTTTPVFLQTPSYVVVLDAQSGVQLQRVTLSTAWNVYTTAWQEASPTATYVPFGVGCSGQLGIPLLAAAPGSRPALGSTFVATIHGVPNGVAIMATGLSNTTYGGGPPLPLGLTQFGLTGCTLFVDPMATQLLLTGTGAATWSWSIPTSTIWFGTSFYNQGFVLDSSANSAGFVASNAAAGWMGL